MNNFITSNGLRWYHGLVWSPSGTGNLFITVLSPNMCLGIYTALQGHGQGVTRVTANYCSTDTLYTSEAYEESLSYAEVNPVVSKVIKSIPAPYPSWASHKDAEEWRKLLDLL